MSGNLLAQKSFWSTVVHPSLSFYFEKHSSLGPKRVGIKDGKLKGSHLSVFKEGDEWEPLCLKIILEPGRQSYIELVIRKIFSSGHKRVAPNNGNQRRKTKGFPLSVFKVEEWELLGLKIILEPGRQSYM
jgi:hypothetical protein